MYYIIIALPYLVIPILITLYILHYHIIIKLFQLIVFFLKQIEALFFSLLSTLCVETMIQRNNK